MKQKEAWSKLPDIPVISKHLREFWEFVAERQAVWHNRFVLKQPPPWTDNPILRDYKFTNVFRDLDHGTQWYMRNVVPRSRITDSKQYNFRNLLFLTIAYRLLNRVETFEDVGLVDWNCWQVSKRNWQKALEARKKKGLRVFTNAHLTLPTNELGGSKIKRYVEVLDVAFKRMTGLAYNVQHAKQAEHVFDLLRSIPCVGRFIAYEILCDLILAKAIRFSEDDWVNPGPGCKRGINLIYPRAKTLDDYQSKIQHLRRNQDFYFEKFHLEFRSPNGRQLTLRGIEHSLCEYQKYYKMQHKAGKQRMHFVPRDWGQLKLKF